MKAHRAFVAKIGYNRNTPSAVLFGPHYLGGAGFFHLYDDQGYGQLKLFMKSWRTPDSLQGKLLRVTLAWAQYNAGTSISILEDTTTNMPHFESEYLASLRGYLASTRSVIELNENFVEPKQRDGDEFLMTIALASQKFKPAQLKRINYCRMYLNILLVSDITNAKGDYIDHLVFSGEAPPAITKHKVNQAKPNDKAWKQWRRLLLMLTHNSPRLKLKKPLGQWLVSWNHMQRKWTFLYDASSDRLYRYTPQGYTQHEWLSRDYDQTPVQTMIAPVISRWAVPVTVISYDQTYRLQWGWQQSRARQIPIEEPADSVFELLPTMEPWEWQLLFDLEIMCDEQTLWEALTTQVCTIASDGSALAGKGSFAWVISDSRGEIIAECKGPVPGAKVTSFRAEGYGILSALQFLISMNRVHGRIEQDEDNGNPQEDAVLLGPLQKRVRMRLLQEEGNARTWDNTAQILQHHMVCDNQSMVNKSNKISKYVSMYPNSTMASEYDVLAEIRAAMQQLGTSQPELTHIKGHQNETKPWHQLTRSAQLNCRADELATQYLNEFPDTNRTPQDVSCIWRTAPSPTISS